MIGAWAGHLASSREALRDVRTRQIPLAAVMVFLTTLTLWSLGQSIVQAPATAADAAQITGSRRSQHAVFHPITE
jgi:hypothetical protein